MSVASKLYGLTAALFALLVGATVASLSGLDGTARHALAIGALIAGVLAAAACLLVVRQLRRGVARVMLRQEQIVDRMTQTIVRGLQAFAHGDMTQHLQPGTSAASEFSRNEIGRLLEGVERFRDLAVTTYVTYNATAEKLRAMIEEVSRTADTIGSSSQQMSASPEQAGEATGEIAHAVTEFAGGVERQVTMIRPSSPVRRRGGAGGRRVSRASAPDGRGRAGGADGGPAGRERCRAGQRRDALGPRLVQCSDQHDPRSGK